MIFKNGTIYIQELKDKPIYKNGIVSIPNQFGRIFKTDGTDSFSPTDLPNLALWLDASSPDNFALNGNQVQTWFDLSDNGNDFSQSNSSYQAVYLNGRVELSADYFDTAPISNIKEIWIVLSNVAGCFTASLGGRGFTPIINSFRFKDSENTVDFGSASSGTIQINNGIPSTNSIVTDPVGFETFPNQSDKTIVRLTLDNVISTSRFFSYIGLRSKMNIYEMIITTSENAEKRSNMWEYLNSKWGVY